MLPSDRLDRRHAVLAISVLAYFGIRFVEFALSIVFKDVKDVLEISTFIVGLAVAASTLTYALAQLPSGALGDRYGHRRVVLGSLALTGAAALLLAAAPSAILLVLGMTLVGLVSGAYYSPATALLAERFPGTGRAIGIHRLGAQAVGLTGPLVGAAVALYGWRAPLVASGIIVVPIIVGYAATVRPQPPADPEASLRGLLAPSAVREILSRPSVSITTAVAGFAQFVDTATFSFLPLLLREHHELSVGVAGALFTVYFVAVAVSQPMAGWLSDRIGRDTVTVGTLGLALAGYVLLAAQSSLTPITVAVVAIGLGMGWGPPVQARIMDGLGQDERGTGFGLVRTLYIGFAALNGLVVGAVVTRYDWTAGIAVLAGALVVGISLVAVYRIVAWTQ